MKAIKVLGLSALLVFLLSERVIAQTENQSRVVRGELIYVLCAHGVNVRSDSLAEVQFTSDSFERVAPFQGWGENKKTVRINGEEIDFVKVRFSSDSMKIGWVAQKYLKLKSDCPGSELPQTSTTNDSLSNISGIDDPRCCHFPLENRPRYSYLSNPANFGARRSGGHRKHAATDLYTSVHSNILAVAPGKVAYSPIDFYMNTKEFAIIHPGGFVVRYGEIAPGRLVRGIEKNARVRTGQVIAKVGQTLEGRRKVAPPMLHLEIYKGTRQGSLSTRLPGNGYFYRRSDLINPTKYVQRWESLTF